MTKPDNRYEEAIVAAHSTPSLRRNQITRAVKKLNMEFDAQFSRMSLADRDEFLDRMFPEDGITVIRENEKKSAPESNLGLTGG